MSACDPVEVGLQEVPHIESVPLRGKVADVEIKFGIEGDGNLEFFDRAGARHSVVSRFRFVVTVVE